MKILAVLDALFLDLKYFGGGYFMLNEAQACAWLPVSTKVSNTTFCSRLAATWPKLHGVVPISSHSSTSLMVSKTELQNTNAQ